MSDGLLQRLKLLPALLLACGATVYCAWQGSALFRADLLSAPARQNVDDWDRLGKGWTVQEWQATRAALQAALKLTPHDPVQHLTLAQLYVTQGLVAWADLPQREAFFEEALMHQQEALRLRPQDGRAWSQAAVSLFALRRPIPELQSAWMQARRFAPREAPVQRALVDLAIATWDTATPDMRGWVLQTWQEASPSAKATYEDDAKRRGQEAVFKAIP